MRSVNPPLRPISRPFAGGETRQTIYEWDVESNDSETGDALDHDHNDSLDHCLRLFDLVNLTDDQSVSSDFTTAYD